MENNLKMLTWLVGLSLILSVVNLYSTYNLSEKVKDGGTTKVAQQPTTNAPTPSAPDQPTGPIDVSVDDDPVEGDANAPVTIVEFSDFECPFCSRFYSQTYSQLVTDYVDTGKVKIVFRDFPLSFHAKSQKAHEAAECADEQGKFWEMHNMLYENQSAIDVADLKGYAVKLGLNANKFNECLDSGAMADEVKADLAQGSSYGVTGTPTFFINGNKLVGAQPYAAFQKIIDKELAK